MASKLASAALRRSAHGLLRRPHATRALAQQAQSLRSALLRSAPPSRGLAAQTKHVWSQEWDKISLGATPPWQHAETTMDTVLFVETGFGCECPPIRSRFHSTHFRHDSSSTVLHGARRLTHARLTLYDVPGATSMATERAGAARRLLCAPVGPCI
jgi:hypothetical protein